ncbi:MAG: AsmA family protein [Terricaulis sp.]
MARAKSVARWGGVVLIVVLVLLGAGAGAVYYLVSRLDMRAEIERAVEQATGRDLTIAGSVGVSFYPVLGLEAHDASLANVEGGRADALAAMDAIKIGVEIVPLFQRNVVVRQLVLEHPRIALEIDTEGRTNWVLRPAAAPAPPSAPRPDVTPNRFSLRVVAIHDGEVSFYDARRGMGWAVRDADLDTALTSLDEPLRLRGSVAYHDQPITLDIGIADPRGAFSGSGTPLTVSVESALLNAAFEGNSVFSSAEMTGQARASGPSLRNFAAWAGSPISGGVGLERFAVSGIVTLGGGRFAFNDAGFTLDQIRGRGDFEIMQRHGKPYVSGRLELFDFDLNPYLTGVAPPQDALEPGGANAPAGAAGEAQTRAEIATVEAAPRTVDITEAPRETPLDLSGLRSINADLEITTAKFLFQHMQIDHALISLVLNDGYLASTLHELNLYGGTGHGRIELDAREDVLKAEQDIALQGVDAARFLTDAANVSNIEGTAELTFRLSTQGRSQSELIAGADGTAHLEVVTGALRGVDLGGVARTIRNALSGDLIAPQARTPFQGFSATFTIGDGVLASRNLSFNTPDLTMPGIGVIDLPARRLDVRLAPRSPRGGGIVIPFAVTGPFGDFDYASDIRDRAKRQIEARIVQVQAAAR